MFEYWDNTGNANGILIWHIKKGFDRWQGLGGDLNMLEKMKYEDLECAIGLYDTSGVGKTECPEWGYDNLDHWAEDWHFNAHWRYGKFGRLWNACFSTNNIYPLNMWVNPCYCDGHNGNSGAPTDFFRNGYKTEFSHLSNPGSDGYNLKQQVDFPYGANSNANPLFVDIANADFRLQSNSPCINAGYPAWDTLVADTAIDIGAYEFMGEGFGWFGGPGGQSPDKPQFIFKLYQNYPNPSRQGGDYNTVFSGKGK